MNQNHSEHDDRRWIIDSGCTAHLCKNDGIFEDISDSNENLNLANNESTKGKGKGTARLKINTNKEQKKKH